MFFQTVVLLKLSGFLKGRTRVVQIFDFFITDLRYLNLSYPNHKLSYPCLIKLLKLT
jgi:hypothetical protein